MTELYISNPSLRVYWISITEAIFFLAAPPPDGNTKNVRTSRKVVAVYASLPNTTSGDPYKLILPSFFNI